MKVEKEKGAAEDEKEKPAKGAAEDPEKDDEDAADDESADDSEAGSEDKLSAAEMRAELKRARADAAKYRVKNSENQKKVREYEEEKSKAEKERMQKEGQHKELAETAQKELEEYKKVTHERLVRAEVKSALVAAGINVSPERAVKLVETKGIAQDDTGEFTGIEEAIEELKKAEPALFKSGESTTTEAKKEVKSTGSEKSDPNPGGKVKPFDALKATPEEAQQRLKELMKA